MTEVRVGVIGAGYWGPNLIRNFIKTPRATLVGVADLDASKLEQACKLYPTLRTTTDASGLIEADDIDAIAIATPISTHFPLAHAALSAGKHVWVEKPLTKTSKEGLELVELAEAKRLKLMIDHTFVYSPPVRKVRELVEGGEFGDILYYDSVRVNLGLFQHDVNVVWDLAPHDFSIMRYVLDKEVVEVSTLGAAPVRREGWGLESIAYIGIRFSDDTVAHLHVNWLSPVKVRRTLIGGSRRMVIYDHLDPDNQVKVFDKGVDLGAGDQSRADALVQYRTGDMWAPKIPQTEALETACAEFVDCIIEDRRPLSDGEFGLEVVRLLEAADESLVTGRPRTLRDA
jgi:predicted dehydrogenase